LYQFFYNFESLTNPRQRKTLHDERPALNDGGDAHEFEHQVVRDFVRSERINLADQHDDLCHDERNYQKGLNFTSLEL